MRRLTLAVILLALLPSLAHARTSDNASCYDFQRHPWPDHICQDRERVVPPYPHHYRWRLWHPYHHERPILQGVPSYFPPSIKQWNLEIVMASTATGVPPAMIGGVIWTESRGDPLRAGPDGLTQVLPATALAFGCNLGSPAGQILCGARVLASFYATYGDWRTALAAYNAGYCCWQSAQAQNYAQTVLNAMAGVFVP